MADQNDRMNRDKAEGERSIERENLSQDETNPSERYDETGERAGGITNRPLDEEIDNQDALPQRGHSDEDEPDRTSGVKRETER